MRIRSAKDIGSLIRAYRRAQHLSQAQLAERVGTSQRWISAIERGKATAELDLVLHTLSVLNVPLEAPPPGFTGRGHTGEGSIAGDGYPDIDALVDGGPKP